MHNDWVGRVEARHSQEVVEGLHDDECEWEVCARCETRKTERFIVGRHGIEKVGQHYDYPDGYLMGDSGVPRGVKRSSIVWAENYRRSIHAAIEENQAVKW